MLTAAALRPGKDAHASPLQDAGRADDQLPPRKLGGWEQDQVLQASCRAFVRRRDPWGPGRGHPLEGEAQRLHLERHPIEAAKRPVPNPAVNAGDEMKLAVDDDVLGQRTCPEQVEDLGHGAYGRADRPHQTRNSSAQPTDPMLRGQGLATDPRNGLLVHPPCLLRGGRLPQIRECLGKLGVARRAHGPQAQSGRPGDLGDVQDSRRLALLRRRGARPSAESWTA